MARDGRQLDPGAIFNPERHLDDTSRPMTWPRASPNALSLYQAEIAAYRESIEEFSPRPGTPFGNIVRLDSYQNKVEVRGNSLADAGKLLKAEVERRAASSTGLEVSNADPPSYEQATGIPDLVDEAFYESAERALEEEKLLRERWQNGKPTWELCYKIYERSGMLLNKK